jgi:hypothetical protein
MVRRSDASRPAPILVCGLLLTLSGLCLGLAAKPSCVSLRITNCAGRTVRVGIGKTTLCAEVRVQPQAEHRKVIVTWDYAERVEASILSASEDAEPDPFTQPESQDGVIGSAEDNLDGEHEPVLIRPMGYKLESLSGGTYEVRAVVLTDQGTVCGSARSTVLVR